MDPDGILAPLSFTSHQRILTLMHISKNMMPLGRKIWVENYDKNIYSVPYGTEYNVLERFSTNIRSQWDNQLNLPEES
jgi:hypothetical protein